MSAYAAREDIDWGAERQARGPWLFANLSATPRGHSHETQVITGRLVAALIEHAFPTTRQDFEITDRFYELARRWSQETMFSSSLTDKTSSPAYTEIVQMGWAAVPLILRELSEAPDYWFAALREITGENPVPGEHRGNLEFMANDWLLWARRQGISF